MHNHKKEKKMRQLIVMLFSCCVFFAGMNLMAKKAEAEVKVKSEGKMN